VFWLVQILPSFRICVICVICGHNLRLLRSHTARSRELFHRTTHLVVLMDRGTDAQENLEAVSNIVAVVAG